MTTAPATEAFLHPVVERAEELAADLEFKAARAWKEAEPGRRVAARLPVAAPAEIPTAAGMLTLDVVGGGDQLEIIRGDAYFQSYICRLPRSVVELGLSERLDFVDAFLFPSTCDVIRNLSGMWKVLFPDKYVRYVDVPQDFSAEMGGAWYRTELEHLRRDMGDLRGAPITDDELRQAIALHDENRALVRGLFDLRAAEPWKVPTWELYLLLRAGGCVPIDEHNDMLRTYREAAEQAERPPRDHARVVVRGAFCEQPPVGLLKTLERAGCWIVDDDLLLSRRTVTAPVAPDGPDAVADPLDALVRAFLDHHEATSTLYIADDVKGRALVETVEERGAEGVVFAAPSFCDPALLDQPMLAAACDRADIPHTALKYSENSGQFQNIREQAGTFADSLKLWSDA